MIEKVLIMGAAGRDFHNFNIYFRGNPRYRVVGFTAAQIPDIEGRCYPPQLAGDGYPQGISIYAEEELADLIRKHSVDLVAFSYSDVTHTHVMHQGAIAMANGADFILLGATYTMLKPKKPLVAVCAVRTGCGKSQTTREVCRIIKGMGKSPVVIRHPMPYGDLLAQEVQRFSEFADFDRHQCTIEEREEYESLVEKGITVYAGIDYEKILKSAEKEADLIVWDGGNNDTPFYTPDLHIVVFDPHRPGHELLYYPGETNMIMADIAIINKVDSAPPEGVSQVKANIEAHAPKARIVMAESAILVDDPEAIRGKRVMVVEDGPTLTHGEMAYGAGIIAARKYGAAEIVDPRSCAAGAIRNIYEKYSHIGPVLPAMGYNTKQAKDLEATINAAACDLVLFATPINLSALLDIRIPSQRVRYEYKDHSEPLLSSILQKRLGGLLGETS